MSGPGRTLAAAYLDLLEPILEQAGGYAIAILRNRADAEDAVQEAATKAYQGFSRYDADCPFKGWWFTILRNCCRDVIRRRRGLAGTSPAGLDAAAQLPDRSAHQDPHWAGDEPWETLARALDRLSAAHREILMLRYFGGCSYRDIAAALGVPEGTVMSRLHAARQRLAAVYRREER
jgi:RNA polymerase sigma-70 factor (ECF subfamily)